MNCLKMLGCVEMSARDKSELLQMRGCIAVDDLGRHYLERESGRGRVSTS